MRSVRKKGHLTDEAVARALVFFQETLRRRGLRHSQVRDLIVQAALNYEGHFEVNDLVRILREKGIHDAHVATVYRTLPLMVETGLIHPTLLSSGERHFYEVAFEREHHDHLVCIECGRVVEFQFEAFEVLQQDLAKRYDFELTDHVHELLGRCGPCRSAS